MALENSDKTRCQVVVRPSAFAIGVRNQEVRCSNKPTNVVKELSSHFSDGLLGEMSMCDDCLEKFKIVYSDKLTEYLIEPIKS